MIITISVSHLVTFLCYEQLELKGTLRCRLSHMFLCSFKTTYIWNNFTVKMILINAAVI